MRRYSYRVTGELVTVNRVETTDDLEEFRDFVRGNLKALACDSEASSLEMYTPGHKLRLMQFGNTNTSYALPVEHGGRFVDDAIRALRGVKRLIFQNGGFDLQVFERHLGVRMEELWPKITDTRILSHLVDPRGKEEGGYGHKLEELIAHYIDPVSAEEVKGLMSRLAKEHKTTKSKIWSIIDLDHPDYNLYAGMDTIFAARLFQKVSPLVPRSSLDLIPFEHKVSEVCSYMERTGFLLDVDYSLGLSKSLRDEEEKYVEIAQGFGCENVNSTEQVADVLESRKVKIKGRTPTGKRKVDKALLGELVKTGDEFAIAVVEAKKARKWRTTWVDSFLNKMDANNRCHPNINSLRARTARMSITGIPAQTLPSGDWMIRRCFLSDEGELMGSIDYMTQELRVLAAQSGDPTMIKAFQRGDNLHLITAHAAFGPHVVKGSKEYKGAKVGNFCKVYGGGASAIAEQTGMDMDAAKQIVAAFDSKYPRVGVLSRRLAAQAASQGYITTTTGRRLPVDAGKGYAALNYFIQSSSRDVTCRGLLRLHEAGFTPYLRLPIHDEILASLPAKKAEWGANEIGKLMSEQMGPVFIGTEPEVGGRSWGSLYGADY